MKETETGETEKNPFTSMGEHGIAILGTVCMIASKSVPGVDVDIDFDRVAEESGELIAKAEKLAMECLPAMHTHSVHHAAISVLLARELLDISCKCMGLDPSEVYEQLMAKERLL